GDTESSGDTETSGDAETSGDTETSGDAESSELEALREENRLLTQQLEQFSDSEAAVRERVKGKRLRRLSISLAVIGALLLPPSVMTVWLRNRVLDTDIYVETVEPLASDPAIQAAVANRIATEVSNALDLESEIESLLPEQAAPLAAFIASGADGLIDDLALSAVQSDQFKTIWEAANREGHAALVAILTGEQGDVLDFSDGQVVLNLAGLVNTVLSGLDDATGLDLASKVPSDALDAQFVLFESSGLADAQAAIQLFDTLSWFLVIVTLACLAGAVLLAPDKRLGFRRIGIGISVSMLLTLVALALGRQAYLNALAGVVESQAAAEAAFDIITNFLRATLRAALALGVVFLLAAWIVGPSRAAAIVRGWGAALSGEVDARTGERDLGPVPRWVRSHVSALTWSTLAIAGVVVVLWQRPTGIVILVIAGAAALVIGVLRLVAAAANDVGTDESLPAGPTAELATAEES
ncbi:MAG: hypothetical protein ACR2OH_15040, partial [Microthrixaceae bacterium]